LAILGGLVLSAMLVLWLRPPSAPATPPQIAPQIAPTPATTPTAITTAAQPTAPPALKLRGILARSGGGSAILENEAGSQRLVTVGRAAAPGWRLAALSPSSATLEDASGAVHILQFEVGETTANPATANGPPITARQDLKATPQSLAATSTAYRLALRPVAGETQLEGWTVQTPETIPLFRLAGLQAGDTLLAINGQPLFSEEKLLELPSEIAGANAVDVEFRRAGRKATVRITLIR
jgi:type II secretion system protein C